MAPQFWLDLTRPYNATFAHAFILHGVGIRDYADESAVAVFRWAMSKVAQTRNDSGEFVFDVVVSYDLANGFTFPDDVHKATFAREVLGIDAGGGNLPASDPRAGAANKAKNQEIDLTPFKPLPVALSIIDKLLTLTARKNGKAKERRFKVALFLPFAADIFPAGIGGGSTLTPDDRIALEYMLSWISNPKLQANRDALIVMFARQLGDVNPALVEAAYTVEVKAPDFDERLRFIEAMIGGEKPSYPIAIENSLTFKRLASLTAGLLRVHILDVIMEALVNKKPLTAEQVKRRKDEVINQVSGGTLTVEEPSGSWADVVGLEELTDYLKYVVEGLKNADPHTPKGIILSGPAGTGKTHLAKILAAEAGVSFGQLHKSALLGKYVGDSEAKLEQFIATVEAMTPMVIFMDEIDTMWQRPEFSGDSGVGSNQFGRLLDWLSDERLRGRVFIIGATNRPDRLDAALTRSGRLEVMAPVLPPHPDDDQTRITMFHVQARLARVKFDESLDLSDAARATAGWTGADIGRVFRKAYEVAQRAGREAITDADLSRALQVIRVNTKNQKMWERYALDTCTDLSLLPAAYLDAIEDDDPPSDDDDEAPTVRRVEATL